MPRSKRPRPVPIKAVASLEDCEKLLEYVVLETLAGRMNKTTGTALTNAAKAWMGAHGERIIKRDQDQLMRDVKMLMATQGRRTRPAPEPEGADD